MGKKLIITEKPSVARDFARVLKVSGNQNGFIENNEYVISWCYGHLVQMVYPEEYDIKYKNWNLEDLPFLPTEYKYGVVESAKDQYKVVNGLLHREDIDTVYWAGDSGKEGQTIEENIRNYGGVRDGMTELRVWIDSQTDDEILRGINEAKPMSDYAKLGASGIMRTIEDYSLGINFSRALSVKYGRLINDAAATTSYAAIAIGRVMTCVLGMVVEREREIRNFNEDPFFKVVGKFSDVNFPAEWKAVDGSKYFESPLLYGDKGNGFKTKDSAQKLIDDLTNSEAQVSDKETGISKKKAPLLFNLAELQSECSKRFKISPAQTLDIIQELYEKKYTTYPRTDARVLTTAVAKEINKNLNKLQSYGPTAKYVHEILADRKYIGIEKTSYTDDSKVTDHYAIIPTGQCNGIENLSPLSQKVYELIVRRFLSIFYPPAEYKNVKITVKIDSECFFAGAKLLVKPGYLEIAGIPKNKKDDTGESDDENEDAEDDFSKEKFAAFVEQVNIGDAINVNGFELKEGKTSPPKRYTSGSLILAMENAGKLIEDEELREQIKTTGIGTSATRGEILEKLVRIGYLNQNNKTQVITPERLGEMIYEVVLLTTPSLLKPEQTANWEKGLEGIINGSVEFDDYRKELEDYIRTETKSMIDSDLTQTIALNINQFTGKDSKGLATRKPLGINCPACGGELTTTSFGYGCSNYTNDEIKCRFSIGQIAGVDLPEEQFRKLILEGKTDLIEGFKSKSNKPFKSVLKLGKNEDGEFNVSFDFSETPTEYVEDLKCPVCGGRIAKTGYGFACEHRFQEENQCYFSVGEIAGRKISLEELAALLNNGITDVLTGFKSKTNQKFSAKIQLKENEEGKKVLSFNFDGIEAEKLPDVKCPDCGGDILVRPSGYGCANFNAQDENSCKFYIGKTIAGKNISPQVVTEILKEGKSDTLRGFKGKTGKKFDARLVLKKNEETGRTELVFDFDDVAPNYLADVVCPDCGNKIIKTNFGFACEKYFDKENKCNFVIGEIASKKIGDGDVKELLTEGHTKTIRGFKGKSGKKFDACLVLKKNEEGKSEITFDFDNVEAKDIKDVVCPVCGGKVVVTPFGYGCSNYKKDDPENSCGFNIGQIAGVKLKEAQVKELLKDGITSTISGFKSKKGTKFDAKLALNKDETGKVSGIKFVFEDEEKVMEGLKCPKCGEPILKNHFGYRCKNNIRDNVDSCQFYVGKVAGVDIPEDQFRKLILEKKTDVISGFLSKKGLFFDARLKLNDECRTEFEFDNYSDAK
ncbi:DNA topoisomerase III [Pseudobutyrivibrio ruminis]|uniref:DNA topoisomerase n=1 Tax=Pseudobutyrivibrio ruminis DSM 9787 TaxID=1123011 RepID=A0A285RDE7_9FIRM|nr:type IA DNA topoisomerase [Pseudobutyrivibrio ruminis]SOB92133.1 DNA topoisomerase-3 [Pseudobutyrivibrio ruminis DSM 9787]